MADAAAQAVPGHSGRDAAARAEGRRVPEEEHNTVDDLGSAAGAAAGEDIVDTAAAGIAVEAGVGPARSCLRIHS